MTGLPVRHVVEQHPTPALPSALAAGRQHSSVIGARSSCTAAAAAKSPSNDERLMIDAPAGRCRTRAIWGPLELGHAARP